MEANHWGKMVVIERQHRDYEIADDDLTATMQLFERKPNAMTWGELVNRYLLHGERRLPDQYAAGMNSLYRKTVGTSTANWLRIAMSKSTLTWLLTPGRPG